MIEQLMKHAEKQQKRDLNQFSQMASQTGMGSQQLHRTESNVTCPEGSFDCLSLAEEAALFFARLERVAATCFAEAKCPEPTLMGTGSPTMEVAVVSGRGCNPNTQQKNALCPHKTFIETDDHMHEVSGLKI